MSRRRPRLDECRTMDDFVRGGYALAVTPNTDAGWRLYGAGKQALPLMTNYILNPRLIENATTNVPGQFTNSSVVTGSLVMDVVANGDGTFYHEVAYTVLAGDVSAGKKIEFKFDAPDSSFAEGDPYSFAMEYQYVVSNARSFTPGCIIYNNTYGQGTAFTVSANADWTEVVAEQAASAAGTTTLTGFITFSIPAATAVAGDTFLLRWRYPRLTKTATAQDYLDGTMAQHVWSGTADASTTVRAATSLIFTDLVTVNSDGVTAAGTNVAYSRNAATGYYGPVVVAASAYSAGEQTALAATWADIPALFRLVKPGDYLIPLGTDSRAFLRL